MIQPGGGRIISETKIRHLGNFDLDAGPLAAGAALARLERVGDFGGSAGPSMWPMQPSRPEVTGEFHKEADEWARPRRAAAHRDVMIRHRLRNSMTGAALARVESAVTPRQCRPVCRAIHP